LWCVAHCQIAWLCFHHGNSLASLDKPNQLFNRHHANTQQQFLIIDTHDEYHSSLLQCCFMVDTTEHSMYCVVGVSWAAVWWSPTTGSVVVVLEQPSPSWSLSTQTWTTKLLTRRLAGDNSSLSTTLHTSI